MNYFLDTEFFEDGHKKPIELISIGLVSEEGREFYAENMDVKRGSLSPWLKQNVVPHLTWKDDFMMPTGRGEVITDQLASGKYADKDKSYLGHMLLPHDDIGPEILKFIGMDPKPKFWAYFADYDWVVFCQIFGNMMRLPETFPMFCRDLKQEMKRLDIEKPSFVSTGPKHNALADARWNLELFKYLKTRGMTPF